MRGRFSLPAALAALIVTAAYAQPAGSKPPTGGTAPATTAGPATPAGTTTAPATPTPAATPPATTTTAATTPAATTTTEPKPAEGDTCFFFGPTFGTDVLNIGWNGYPTQLGVLPGLRAGFWLPKGFLAGEAGLKLSAAPASSFSQFNAKLGLSYAYDFGSSGALHAYGLGGLDVGIQAGSASGFGSTIPQFGLTLAGGIQYPVGNNWTLGGELGLHTLFELSSNVYLSTGVFVSVVGSWSLPGPCSSHPGTIERPPHPPDEGTVPPEGPMSTPPPEIITHYDSYNTPCSVYVTDGWMEPSQDVWQDDITFEDKPGKQLSRLSGDAVAYAAEMPMATRKATLLFGAHHYVRGGAPTIVDSRDSIVLSGMTNCTTPKPVKFRFRLTSAGPPQIVYVSPEVGQIKLSGPAQKEYEAWSVRLPVRDGVPTDNVFTIDTAGGYQITAELLAEGNPTGLQMTVVGEAKNMMGPMVHFVPVLLSKPDQPSDEAALITLTEVMAESSALRIPDVFPLAPGGLPTRTLVLRNLIDAQVPDRWFEVRRISYLVAALNDTLAASAFLDGAGRVIAVMPGKDFRAVFGTGAAGMTVAESVNLKPRGESARTLSWKVMLVPSYEGWDTVAHELLHTLPEGWASDEMKAECGRAYHNLKDPVAHGESITFNSAPTKRERLVALISLMGPSVPFKETWIDQCTYWHLTKMLAGAPPDPPVMMVRAMLGTKKGKPMGELRPVYELMGNSDLANNLKSGDPYAFVFKDAKGAVLARFPFNPRGTDIETRAKLEVMSFVGRVPLVPGWASLELHGPGDAVLDKKTRSDTPPQVAVDSPKDMARVAPEAGNKVKVFWTTKAAVPSLTLLSSVLYSSDRGEHWVDQAFERPINQLDVALDPKATEHLIKVVTTDGTRSAEAIIRLLTNPAPAPRK
ncbi:MAG TPA: hypothetical protein VIG99_24660 [Myxococcaceae bacterium]|jgi:hypothetical protein